VINPARGASAAGVAALRLIPLSAAAAPRRRLKGSYVEGPRLGILLVVGASVLFSFSDAGAKLVTQTLPVVELAWVRYVVFVLLALLPAARRGGGSLWRTRRPLLQMARGVAIVASAIFFILGLRVLPLADAAAINFVSPLFITALSVPLLGETVGLRRWIAVGVGLCGAVFAAQPGSDAFRPAAALPVLSAMTWALGIIATRRLGASDAPATTLLWTAVTGLFVLTCLLPLEARVPSPAELGLCLLIGVVASGGQWMVVLGYRQAPASLLAPFSYLQLIWSTLLGFLVFGARPAPATLIGAVVIAASGLYTASRERAAR
jgi:drug/metabolite transporter (DMT)-like permease